MSDFQTARAMFGDYPTIELIDARRQRRVRIALHGATVLAIEVQHGTRVHDFADGYRSPEDLAARPGSRFAIMLPFANRIADARYAFDGQSHDLQPGVENERSARHGFVRDLDFAVDELGADADGAHASFVCAIGAEQFPGYPFALALTVRYTLDADGLALTVTMRNTGTQDAPCFFGWHPYFRVGDTPLDRWELHLPADATIRTDAAAIPLPGAAAQQPLDAVPALDFRTPRAIGALHLDNGFAALHADADGRIRSVLRDPASGLGVAMWQEHGIALAFSGDSLAQRPRQSVALEPMESWTNAFNRPECADTIRLPAGQSRTFRCGVEWLGL